ncbi:CWF complex protein sap62 [Saitoella coloradoensis]
MDHQNRVGSKTGGGGVASRSESNVDRRERLRKLALETIDLEKDPYYFRNHLGSYECKLCLTLHVNDGSYLAHTQGKKHQTNLARRAARDAKQGATDTQTGLPIGLSGASAIPIRKNILKIGRPGYKITKLRDPVTRQPGFLFQLQYPEIATSSAVEGETEIKPRHRFMSAYEQHREPADRAFQYLLVAAEPYETVAFKLQSREIDRSEGKFWTHWDRDGKVYSMQFFFKGEREERFSGVPGMGPSRR